MSRESPRSGETPPSGDWEQFHARYQRRPEKPFRFDLPGAIRTRGQMPAAVRATQSPATTARPARSTVRGHSIHREGLTKPVKVRRAGYV
jgi:hypothetical protein